MRSGYVMPFQYVLCSIVFSKPVWRYPITASIPATCSPSSCTISRSTPWVEGWFGPKLTVRMSSSSCSPGSACPRRSAPTGRRPSRLSREPDRLAADRVVLPQRMALPVLGHQDPDEVRVAAEDDPHQVERLALEPVGGRPDGDDRGDLLAVVDPCLDPDALRCVGDPEQVVDDREPLRLRVRHALEALRPRSMHVAAGGSADVARHLGRAPPEVVDR